MVCTDETELVPSWVLVGGFTLGSLRFGRGDKDWGFFGFVGGLAWAWRGEARRSWVSGTGLDLWSRVLVTVNSPLPPL